MAGQQAAPSAQQEDLEVGAPPPDQLSRHEFQSLRGRDARFNEAPEEVERILRVQKNYYAVLKVRKDTPANEVRANYFRVSRLVHPDKCAHLQAADAAAVVNQSYDTLSNAVKKVLYDRYVDDAGDMDAPEGVSYADWEAQQAVNVQIPAWMESVLRIPGGGICLLIILLPLTLLLVLVCLLLFVLCLPLRLALAFCCGVQPPRGGPDIPDDAEPVIIDIHAPAPAQAPAAEGAAAATGKEAGTAAEKQAYQPPAPVSPV